MKYEAECFLVDCGINTASMLQLVPETYRASAAKTINIDQAIGEQHDRMHAAYKKMAEIDKQSIHCVQDQGSAEITISLLAHQIKLELASIGKTSDEVEGALQRVADEALAIQHRATKDGTMAMVEASIKIWGKYERIAHRLELVNHRRTPEISCKPFNFRFDGAGDGGNPAPNLTIKHAGIMPYCGPSYGLADMEAVTENIFQTDDMKPEVIRHKGQPIQRPPRESANLALPDIMGEGLFKAGTEHKDGHFQCPSDVSFDVGEGHTQSTTLDTVAGVIRKLQQLKNALLKDKAADAEWTVEGITSSPSNQPGTSSGTQHQEDNTAAPAEAKASPAGAKARPKTDPPDSGRTKRVAITVEGATSPQQAATKP